MRHGDVNQSPDCAEQHPGQEQPLGVNLSPKCCVDEMDFLVRTEPRETCGPDRNHRHDACDCKASRHAGQRHPGLASEPMGQDKRRHGDQGTTHDRHGYRRLACKEAGHDEPPDNPRRGAKPDHRAQPPPPGHGRRRHCNQTDPRVKPRPPYTVSDLEPFTLRINAVTV